MTLPVLPGPFWLIGCGNMAGAMLEGWLSAGLDPGRITVVRPSGRTVGHGIRVLTRLPEDEVPALVMLGVKPQMLDAVAPTLAPALDPHTILLSILAGTRQASLRTHFPACDTIVRVMPNTPVRIRKGAIGLFSERLDGATRPGSAAKADGAARALVESLMAALGTVSWTDSEDLFDVMTALSGSGPAFLYRFIDALAESATALGLPRDQAHSLALATVEGAAALAAERVESPFALAERVASPGGSTRAGLEILDGGERLTELLTATLQASVRRNRELAALAGN